tara:strand:- start:137 stop:457 length:321 start_codon:yes stop_codon:yes gene_type:complete
MKLWNKNVPLTTCIIMTMTLFFSTLVLASVWPAEVIIIEEEEAWIPTAEDIAYQDSMYTIIKSTQNDLTDIKEDIVHILERLDYADGTYDSIRYVKGGKIDKRRNQ